MSSRPILRDKISPFSKFSLILEMPVLHDQVRKKTEHTEILTLLQHSEFSFIVLFL